MKNFKIVFIIILSITSLIYIYTSYAQKQNIKKDIVINIKDFGAVGDGINDDYERLKKAFEKINTIKTGTLYFPPGNYLIGVHKYQEDGSLKNNIKDLILENCSNITILATGAKLISKGGWSTEIGYEYEGFTYSYHSSVSLFFENCKNLKIIGLEFDGGSRDVKKIATAEGNSYGIVISGGKDIVLKNLNLHHFCTDGLYIDSSGPIDNFKVTRNLTVIDSVFDSNARQGVSIIQLYDGKFINCTFSNTGKSGLYGSHSPAAGVDIEPNYIHDDKDNSIKGDLSTGKITFTKCIFKDNDGFQLVATNYLSTKYPIKIVDSDFINTSNNVASVVSSVKNISFEKCRFNEVGLWPNYSLNNNPTTTEVIGSTFTSKNPNLEVLLFVDDKANFIIKNSKIILNSTESHKEYRIFLRGKGVIFNNNNINISNKESNTNEDIDMIALIQNAKNISNNFFSTEKISKMFVAIDGSNSNNNKSKNINYYK